MDLLNSIFTAGPGCEGRRGEHLGPWQVVGSDLVPRAQAFFRQSVQTSRSLLRQIQLVHAAAQCEELHLEEIGGHGALHLRLHNWGERRRR